MPSIDSGMHLIHALLDFLKGLSQPETLGRWTNEMGPWFYVLVFAVVFCETGLVVTPFLPGDSLLFAIGAVSAAESASLSLPLIAVCLMIAAILGDAVNYAIGLRIGPKIFKSESSRLLNKDHLLKAQAFYEKYGPKAIVLARFVPIVRTFAPFVAGIGRMSYAKFGLYNVVGAVLWVALCVGSGRLFGQIAFVQRHFELVLIAIIVISVLPVVFEIVMARRKKSA